ncbi:hypothetical protein [Arthrobacter sp. Leaf234]|uniref:hypothetical protein n=1 Tax=Arthrobacter sp. Leaf234 TaxID=1736303 RepID=UPI000A77BACD|nr:hypothetical protein [Arthrobacter sp. Leaf234]
MPVKPLKRAELAERYADQTWRDRYLDLSDLVSLLRDCIIESNYKVSDELNGAITLSTSGRRIRDQLVTKEQVNPKEANVLTLLGLVHIDPLIDVMSLDFEKLELAISNEIKSKALSYPLIYGRSLYDRAAELFTEERDYLRHDDTLKLLKDMPQGVFQAGKYLIGPFGLLKCDHLRLRYATTTVPLQHCSDHSCPSVHRVQLSTSYDAGVNRNRRALNKILDQISDESSEWNGFMSDITADALNGYEVNNASTMPELLGDGFSDAELRIILQNSPKLTAGRTITAAKSVGLSGLSDSNVKNLDRAQMLQLLWSESDEDLAKIVDSCVRDNFIKIPEGEIRRPKVNAQRRSGAWRLGPQLSQHGVRFTGGGRQLPLLRLSALSRSLFNSDSAPEIEELAWLLRDVPGDTTEARLEEFLRVSEPRLVIEKLVLASKKNAEHAGNELKVPLNQPDIQVVDALLWKLGFPLGRRLDVRDDYWRNHEKLESFVRTAESSLGLNEERLRGLSSNYLVNLGKFIMDSLTFLTWSLLNDHHTTEQSYVFYPNAATQFTIQTLNQFHEGARRNSDNDLKLDSNLSQIVQGFSRLSKHLEQLRVNEDKYRRTKGSYPKFHDKTQLQKFPFNHIVPFLDLTAESQVKFVQVLAQVSADLNDSGIMTARNGLLHAKQETPSLDELREALERSRRALDRLEQLGGVRTTYFMAKSQANSWGRWNITMESSGKQIQFSTPSSYSWLGLPGLTGSQYLIHGALFAPPNEMLRFVEGFESEYAAYWSGYERRPEPGNRIVSGQSENLAAPMETGTFVAAKAD